MTQSRPEPVTIRDPAVLRAMAHPARLAILDYITAGREATATEAAEISGLSPSATSYHLRELAKAGLIEEAPGRGDGRERVWRRRTGQFNVDPENPNSPESRQATMALVDAVLAHEDVQVRRWFAKISEQPGRWSDAVGMYNTRVLVTAEELRTVVGRLMEILAEYEPSSRTDPPPDSRRVAVQFRVVPTDEV